MNRVVQVTVLALSVFAWLAVYSGGSLAFGQTPAASPPSTAPGQAGAVPKAQFDGLKHDFGKVWDDTKLEHVFTVRNTGTADLHILAVKPSCGCTTAGAYSKVIAPGKAGELPFKVDGARYKGTFATTVEIETNDPTSKSTRLTLSGFMQHYVDMTPTYLLFDKLKPDAGAERTVAFTKNGDKPIKLSVKQPVNPSPVFKWELREVEADKKYELVVKASPPYATKYSRQLLEIETGIPGVPPMRLICTAISPPRIDVEPESLYVPAGMQAMRRPVKLTINDNNPVKLLEAVSLDPAVKVNVTVRSPGKDYLVDVGFPEKYSVPAGGTAVVLKTDDAKQPEIRVLVRGPAAPRSLTQTQPALPVTSRPQAAPPAAGLVGSPAPQISATTFDGKPLKIGAGSDRVQMLVFYASWCGFARRALPYIQETYQQYKDKAVDIVAINLDSRTGNMARTEDQTLATYKELKLSMPMSMDSAGQIGPKYRALSSPPTFVLIGKGGIIEAVHFGVASAVENILAREIDLLLEGKNRTAFPIPPSTVQRPQVPTPPTTRPTTPPRPAEDLAGKPAPAAAVKAADGKDLKIGPGAGKVQLLAFYASWCGFCKRAMPAIEQIHKDYAGKGIEVIAINEDSRTGRVARTEEQSLATYKEWNLSMPLTMDPDQKIAREYSITGFPTFFVVGKTGTVEAVHRGYPADTDDRVRKELDLLLQGKTRADFPPPATRPVTPRPSPLALSGKPAPAAALKASDGKELKIGAGAGKVQFLAFYASWCGFCKRAMPAIEQLHKDYGAKGVEVIAVNLDSRVGRGAKTEEQTLATYKEWNLSMPMSMDPEQKTAGEYSVTGYPTFFIVGKTGTVEAVHVGYPAGADETVRKELNLLLQGKTRADFPGATMMAPSTRPAS